MIHEFHSGVISLTLTKEHWRFITEEATVEDFYEYLVNTSYIMTLHEMSDKLGILMARFRRIAWGEPAYMVSRLTYRDTVVYVTAQLPDFNERVEFICNSLGIQCETVTFIYCENTQYLGVTFDSYGNVCDISTVATPVWYDNSVYLNLSDWFVLLRENSLNALLGTRELTSMEFATNLRRDRGYSWG